jgi:FkbM family methyltransferase
MGSFSNWTHKWLGRKRLSPDQQAAFELDRVRARKGDICIDCGANVGEVTEVLARRGATVYAFEPNPHAYAVLSERFADRPNVHCRGEGVYDREDELKLHLHESSDEDEVYWSTGSSLLASKGNVLEDKYVTVPVIDLSAFIRSLEQDVKILKIDVEGAECDILRKMIDEGTLERCERVFVETHDHKMPELVEATDRLREEMRSRGFDHVNLDWR